MATSSAGHDGPAAGPRGVPARAGVVAARAAAALLGTVALFHAVVALGAPWGELTQGGGTTGTLPVSGRVVAGVSCLLSLGMAATVLGRVGLGPMARAPHRVTTAAAWATTAYAAIGVVLNTITPSAPERALWAPVSVVLLGLLAFVMLAAHRTGERRRGT